MAHQGFESKTCHVSAVSSGAPRRADRLEQVRVAEIHDPVRASPVLFKVKSYS